MLVPFRTYDSPDASRLIPQKACITKRTQEVPCFQQNRSELRPKRTRELGSFRQFQVRPRGKPNRSANRNSASGSFCQNWLRSVNFLSPTGPVIGIEVTLHTLDIHA